MNKTQLTYDKFNSTPILKHGADNVRHLFNNMVCNNCALHTLCTDSKTSSSLPKQLANITQHPKPMHRGDHLYRQGDTFRNLYVVRSGAIKLYISTHDGSEQIINFYYPGEILSLDAIETGFHNTSAVALDTTSVCALPYNQIKALCHHQPDYYDELFMIMAREIGNEHNLLLLLGQKPSEERFATFLLDTANRTNIQKTAQSEFLLSMTRHEIASYLCLAAETVSRLINKFTESKIIKVKGRKVEVLDYSNLERIANIWQPQITQAKTASARVN
jgi:CRP/FNR family transcriptional regulator